MANKMTGKPVSSGWAGVKAGLAIMVLFASVLAANAQQLKETGQPPRVRFLLKSAEDHYKSGDYEGAAQFFAQVQISQNELTPSERNDFKNYSQRNIEALASQKEGSKQLHLAEEAVRLGKKAEANRLIKGLTANQYLSEKDKQTLASLNDTLRGTTGIPLATKMAAPKTYPSVPNDEKSLLKAGRDALKQGDIAAAEAYLSSAEKVAPYIHYPFAADTPSKLKHDIQVAKAKAPPSPSQSIANGNPPEKRESNGIVKQVQKMLWHKDEKKDIPTSNEKMAGPDLPPPPPVMINNESKSTSFSPGKQQDGQQGPPLRQTTYPGGDPNAPPSSISGNRTLARKLIKDGYKALENNDLESARRFAKQAKDLHPELEWWEENPARLMEEIQRRATGKTGSPGANANGKPAVIYSADARTLVKDARGLLQQGKIEEAENLTIQAAATRPKGWGLFEDSPDKLRGDIQKARSQRDREESARLLVEARKLYASGNIQEAKSNAMIAQKLHGPYTIWDLGDRPQRLIEEIQIVEAKNPGMVNKTDLPNGPDTTKVAQKNPPGTFPLLQPNKSAPPMMSGTAQAALKIQAVALLHESREFQKKGMLIEARSKALEADRLRVTFGPDEDSPAGALVSLAAQCERTVDQLLVHATDQVQNHPTDPNRFKKAEADVNRARLFARTFRLDNMRIEQKAQWLQQAAVSSGVQPLANNMAPDNSQSVIQVSATLPGIPQMTSAFQPPVDSGNGKNRLMGLEKLDKARLELTAGNLPMARRLAEEAFNPMYGSQEEAAMVLRSIDADEYNHQVNMANRNADAGIEAFKRGDIRQATAIINSIDIKLVQADKARRIGELMTTRSMQQAQGQPPAIQQTAATDINPNPNPGANAGMATATDLQAGDDLTKSFRAMEEIQFQQMRDRGMSAQNTAMELFKAGRKAQAVDVLRDYLDELTPNNFDPQRLALLKRPVENRLQKFRTVMAQETIEKQVENVPYKWDETKNQKAERKTKEEVAEQIKLYRVLQKEGKYKEALAAARKAKELDPDNLAADAAIQITSIKIAQMDYDKGKSNNEETFIKSLNPDSGPYVDLANPVKLDPEAMKRMLARKNGENGYWSPTRDATERSIERRLQEPISLTFKDTPLHQVVSDLSMLSGVNIIADTKALQDANISLDMPLTLPVEKISLKSALNILLDQVNLTYVIKDQVLQITTKEKAQGRMRMVTYSVADLVVPVENHPVPGVTDMNTALARTLASNSGMINSTASPFTTPLSLPSGSSVSSQGSGMGGTFAMNNNGVSQPNAVMTRAPGETIQDLLIGLIQNTIANSSWSNAGGQGTIQYYPLGMALVVNQTQEVQEDVAALLQSLRRLQDLEVAIEMRLVSVSESFFEQIGVDFNVNLKSPTHSANQIDLVNGQFTPFGQVNSQFQGINAVTGLTPAGTLTPDLGIPIKASSSNFSVPPFGGFPGTLGADGGISLGLAFLSDIQVFMFLEAAQGDRRMNIMQAPKITVFNGQTANISVNDFQFFLTGVSINQANGQIFFSPNNQPFPLGVTMQVTPVVSADRRFVRLNLTPNLTNLTNANVPLIPVQIPVPQLLDGPGNGSAAIGQPAIFQMFFQQPTFTSITVNTTVNVPDGGTVLLGGLKTMSEGRNEFGPPILGKIPYLNRLFTNTAYGRDGQSLMIMVTPRIIINEEETEIFVGNQQPIPRP